MPVTLCEWTPFTTEYRSRARWDHDCDIFAVRRDRCVGEGAAVVSAPSAVTLVILTSNLIEQRADLGRIVGVLVREGLRNYRAVVGIDRSTNATDRAALRPPGSPPTSQPGDFDRDL